MSERPDGGWLPPVPPAAGGPAGTPPPPPPPPPAWQPPPPQRAQRPPAAWRRPAEPENKPANVGFALSISAAAALVLTAGVLGVVALPLAIGGWIKGREGVRRVESGATTRNATLARAAVVVGIVTTVLSALAIAALVVLIATGTHLGHRHHERLGPGGERADASAIVAASRWPTRI